MKKILILEDNQRVLRHLSDIVRETDAKSEIYAFRDIGAAYRCALERTMDLFLVDIILDANRPGDLSGLIFVENIRKIKKYSFSPVIFITSLEDEKLYTYEKLHCYRFIEKPFDAQQLKGLVEECLDFPRENVFPKTLYYRKEGVILAVERDDIVYAESVNHIMNIHTKKKDVMTIPYISIKKFLEDADSNDFVQCSRNSVINTRFVYNVDFSNRIIQLKDQMGRVEIGVTYKKQMKELFK